MSLVFETETVRPFLVQKLKWGGRACPLVPSDVTPLIKLKKDLQKQRCNVFLEFYVH